MKLFGGIRLLSMVLLAAAPSSQGALCQPLMEEIQRRSVVPQVGTESVQALQENAARAVGDGNWREAEQLYKRAITASKKSGSKPEVRAMLLCNLGAVQFHQKKTDEALASFEDSVKLCRTSKPNTNVCTYIGKQYSSVLKRLGRDNDASVVLEQSKQNFASTVASSEISKQAVKDPSKAVIQEPPVVSEPPQSNSQDPSVAMKQTAAQAQAEVEEFILKEALRELDDCLGREGGYDNRKKVFTPIACNPVLGSQNVYEADVSINFADTKDVPGKGTFRFDMWGKWHYKVEWKSAGNVVIMDKQMPLDVKRSTITRIR